MLTDILIAASLLIQAGPQSSVPWAGAHFIAPAGTQTATHDCEAGRVQTAIRSQGMGGAPRIERISIGRAAVPARRLASLNERLGALGFYSSFTVTCRGPWVAVNLSGNVWDAAAGRGVPGQIGAVFGEGRMWLTDSRAFSSEEIR